MNNTVSNIQQSLQTSTEYGDLGELLRILNAIYNRKLKIYFNNYTSDTLSLSNKIIYDNVSLEQDPDIIIDLNTNLNFIDLIKKEQYSRALYFTSFYVHIDLEDTIDIPNQIGTDIYSVLKNNKILPISHWIDTLNQYDYLGLVLLNQNCKILNECYSFVDIIKPVKPYREYYSVQ